MISGEAESFEISEGMRLGANAFLAKPFSLEKLLEIITKIDFDMLARQKSAWTRKEMSRSWITQTWLNKITDFVHARRA
ncbi:MAG: hypothetical protein V1913_02950 [Fibrobacterota bacterium]